MPLFGQSESSQDAGQNTQLLSLSQRLSSLEAYNAGNRLGVLEAVNSASRLLALESLNAGNRLLALEAIPAPTLASLGAEAAGSAAGAITAHKAEADPHIQYAKISQLLETLEAFCPTSHVHHYGYGLAYNGANSKSLILNTATGYEFYRYAKINNEAINDIYEFDCLLRAGSYNIEFLYDKDSTRGIASLYLNDVLFGTLDAYNSSRINVNRANYSISVSRSGSQKFKIKMASKNASSINYGFGCTAIFISPAAKSAVLINCGDSTPYTDTFGAAWAIDQYFTGGTAYEIEQYVGAFTVAGSSDQRLFKTERSIDNGSFTYNIPVVAGTYDIYLYFSENYHSQIGQRVGNISLNGQPILSNFDILKEVATHTALIKLFPGKVVTGTTIQLVFSNTLINAIKLVKVS